MAILFSSEIMDAVVKELHRATDSVQIITAYCKEKTLKRLDYEINSGVKDKRLLVRFRLEDLLKGSTDFEILQYGLDRGWKVYVRFDLHAKTYIVDNKRGLVGSANVTNSGFNLGKSGNMEMAAFVDIEEKDIKKIENLFKDAVPVTEDLLLKMKQQFDAVNKNEESISQRWDKAIMNLFKPCVETLFSYELPDEFELKKGEYFSFLDETFDGNKVKMKEIFSSSNCYLWLIDTLKNNNGCMYFGKLSESLHIAVVSDPKPYRKDIKIMLMNLLKLIKKLEIEEIIIDRPNYSQRIRLKEI